MIQEYCPEGGKIHMIIFISLVFTCLLTSCSIIGNKQENKQLVNDALVGTGWTCWAISLCYTLYLLKIDLFDTCKAATTIETCKDGCKWYGMSPFSFDNGCKKVFKGGPFYLFVFFLCSVYLLAFGIILVETVDDKNHEKEITGISIAAIIGGAIGILFTLTDLLLCSFKTVIA
jgi:hypothetical protein